MAVVDRLQEESRESLGHSRDMLRQYLESISTKNCTFPEAGTEGRVGDILPRLVGLFRNPELDGYLSVRYQRTTRCSVRGCDYSLSEMFSRPIFIDNLADPELHHRAETTRVSTTLRDVQWKEQVCPKCGITTDHMSYNSNFRFGKALLVCDTQVLLDSNLTSLEECYPTKTSLPSEGANLTLVAVVVHYGNHYVILQKSPTSTDSWALLDDLHSPLEFPNLSEAVRYVETNKAGKTLAGAAFAEVVAYKVTK